MKHNGCLFLFLRIRTICLQVRKNVTVPFFHAIWQTYSKHLWAVFMLKWYLDKNRNVFKL